MKNQSLPTRIAFAVVPVLISLLVTALLIILVGADPGKVVTKLWSGAFADLASVSNVINFWIPLTLASIGLVVTFTAGLWNIGVEGQILMGALFASGVALYWHIPAPFLVPVEILLAMLGGALWATLVGVLKVYLGVHEIFGGVALNALAGVIGITLITGPWRAQAGVRAGRQRPGHGGHVRRLHRQRHCGAGRGQHAGPVCTQGRNQCG